MLGDAIAQGIGGAVGIAVQFAGQLLVGFLGARAGAQRAFVRRQLVDPLDTHDGAFATLVGGDVEDTGLRLGHGHDANSSGCNSNAYSDTIFSTGITGPAPDRDRKSTRLNSSH